MSFQKSSKTYQELVQILKDRNLVVSDESRAVDFLSRVHYYRLSAYYPPFQSKKDSFDPNITFEDIVRLYEFDAELRKFVFAYIEKVEIALRAKIVQVHTQRYGTLGYAENIKSLDMTNMKNMSIYCEVAHNIQKEKTRTKEVFVQHFKDNCKMNDLPLWACVELLSFGNLSKLFSILLPQDKKAILQDFGLNLHPKPFQNWLMCLTTICNICAHHARLWNRVIGTEFVIPNKTSFLHKEVNRRKIFFALSVLAQILKDSSIKVEFKALLDKYPTIPTKSMGIPQSWEDLSPWSNL
ncbi:MULTISPECIES: Abi family protein [unclassified Helicobacter]|uniref:Abi family protein n=1 Tax=unclassified Helicobacter TaxID=2593540 RepID=UPI000CF0836C|nr:MULTISPECIES: Abi family protein [unclassified Helicobacter]